MSAGASLLEVVGEHEALLLMLALESAGTEARETWVDTRLCGLAPAEIAARDGITTGAVSMRVKSAERRIRRYLDRGGPPCLA